MFCKDEKIRPTIYKHWNNFKSDATQKKFALILYCRQDDNVQLFFFLAAYLLWTRYTPLRCRNVIGDESKGMHHAESPDSRQFGTRYVILTHSYIHTLMINFSCMTSNSESIKCFPLLLEFQPSIYPSIHVSACRKAVLQRGKLMTT